MTTTDTDALIERIARALMTHECDQHEDQDECMTCDSSMVTCSHPPFMYCDEHDTAVGVGEPCPVALEHAAAALPIVREEVRKAKAEALREAADAWHAEHRGTRPGPYNWMWDRATEYEAGDPVTADEYEAITEAEWKVLATTEITHLTDEEKDYLPRAWDEWIARVRRDAKAEAWDDCGRSLFRWFNDSFAGDEPPRNPYTESGDSDEHR